MDEMKKNYDNFRTNFLFEEKLYKKYMGMRDDLMEELSSKYGGMNDKFQNSKEFEYGFLCWSEIISINYVR